MSEAIYCSHCGATCPIAGGLRDRCSTCGNARIATLDLLVELGFSITICSAPCACGCLSSGAYCWRCGISRSLPPPTPRRLQSLLLDACDYDYASIEFDPANPTNLSLRVGQAGKSESLERPEVLMLIEQLEDALAMMTDNPDRK